MTTRQDMRRVGDCGEERIYGDDDDKVMARWSRRMTSDQTNDVHW